MKLGRSSERPSMYKGTSRFPTIISNFSITITTPTPTIYRNKQVSTAPQASALVTSLSLPQQNKTKPSSKMQFTTIAAIFFAGLAAAVPTAEVHERGDYTACTGLYGTSQCCATDVLGVADLDCANPPEVPISADNFSEVCSAIGQRARCCVLPILGQDVLCQTPVGVDS